MVSRPCPLQPCVCHGPPWGGQVVWCPHCWSREQRLHPVPVIFSKAKEFEKQRQQNYSFYQTSKNSILIVFQGVEESMGKDCTGGMGGRESWVSRIVVRIQNKHHWACLFFSPGERRASTPAIYHILLSGLVFHFLASVSNGFPREPRKPSAACRSSPTCLTRGRCELCPVCPVVVVVTCARFIASIAF